MLDVGSLRTALEVEEPIANDNSVSMYLEEVKKDARSGRPPLCQFMSIFFCPVSLYPETFQVSHSCHAMDTPITGDRINEERAFAKRYTEGLSGHKVEYPADFSTPLKDRPRKVSVVGVSHV